MASRVEVYRAIDGELLYQHNKYGKTSSSDETGQGERTLDEVALYISGYSNHIANLAISQGGKRAKLDAVRKIAALCVKVLEQYNIGSFERI